MFKRHQTLRLSASGQAIAESVVALMLITMATVVAVLFMVNTGMSTYYKEKLGFIANQSALFALAQVSSDPSAATQAYAKDLLKQLGLGSGNPSVTIKPATVGGQAGYAVTVSDSFGLFGRGDLLGVKVSLSDTAIATQAAGLIPTGLIVVGMGSGPGTAPTSELVVPCYQSSPPGAGIPVSFQGLPTFSALAYSPGASSPAGANLGPITAAAEGTMTSH